MKSSHTIRFSSTTTTAAGRHSTAAVKIQSAYRSHTIRKLTNTIKSVNHEADKLQNLIQRQETVDAVRSNNKERIKINEALMKLLCTLDSVPGFDPTVREFRRNVSRRIVGLQKILDSVCEANEGNWTDEEGVPVIRQVGESSTQLVLPLTGQPIEPTVAVLAARCARDELRLNAISSMLDEVDRRSETTEDRVRAIIKERVLDEEVRGQMLLRLVELEAEIESLRKKQKASEIEIVMAKKKADEATSRVDAALSQVSELQHGKEALEERTESAMALVAMCLMMVAVAIRAGVVARPSS